MMFQARQCPPRQVPAEKFNADGTVRPFAGNTVICHLDQQGDNAAPFDALLDIYREVQGHAFVRRMALLPPSSYHMTLFSGVNDQGRGRAWPADLPPDLPIEECSRILAGRLAAGGPYPAAPIRMRVDTSAPPADEKSVFRIRLLPFDQDEAARLQELRDRLARVLGFRRASHDRYVFHISIAYLTGTLSPGESADFSGCLGRWHQTLEQRCRQITLGIPEFCTFKDMYAFRRLLYLPQ